MEEIAKNIYIENQYPGVVLGAIQLSDGMLMIDAPFRLEDQQSWRAQIKNLERGANQLLVMLDTHIDRTLGIRAMQTPVLGHQNAVEIMTSRPITARGQDFDAGADWEPYDLPASIRWAIPDMTYTLRVSIHWDDEPIIITHQSGAHLAGSWLQYEAKKTLFVGDSVIVGQPPFLAWSDLDIWLEELRLLVSEPYKDYTIISGREGVVRIKHIEKMIKLLLQVKDIVMEIGEKENRMDAIVKSVPSLLKKISFDRSWTGVYQNRLIWGLDQYIQRHYPQMKRQE